MLRYIAAFDAFLMIFIMPFIFFFDMFSFRSSSRNVQMCTARHRQQHYAAAMGKLLRRFR